MEPFKRVLPVLLLSLAGCTPVLPRELADARAAYRHAAASPAADLAPSELHKAEMALAKAESAYSSAPSAVMTRDLSYVAQRKAELAEALGAIERSNRDESAAGQSIHDSEHDLQTRTQGELTDTRERLAASEQRSAAASEDALSKLAAVTEEPRGRVITLPNSGLFAGDQATLLPAAQAGLDQVAAALVGTRERNVLVEGHTDSHGSDPHDLELSQRRADAVRSYLVARGYESAKIRARGIGKSRPLTRNDSVEGRAKNRRVEIVIESSK